MLSNCFRVPRRSQWLQLRRRHLTNATNGGTETSTVNGTTAPWSHDRLVFMRVTGREQEEVAVVAVVAVVVVAVVQTVVTVQVLAISVLPPDTPVVR